MWLIGMMGSGKSTIGAKAADTLSVEFFDTDQMVTDRAGKSIVELWEEVGEAGFRALEHEVVTAVPARGCLAAAGGGAVLDPRNRVVIADSPPVVWLRAKPETLARRVGALAERPLLDSVGAPGERIRQILSERSEVYGEVATHAVDTDDRAVEAVVEEVVAIWRG